MTGNDVEADSRLLIETLEALEPKGTRSGQPPVISELARMREQKEVLELTRMRKQREVLELTKMCKQLEDTELTRIRNG